MSTKIKISVPKGKGQKPIRLSTFRNTDHAVQTVKPGETVEVIAGAQMSFVASEE